MLKHIGLAVVVTVAIFSVWPEQDHAIATTNSITSPDTAGDVGIFSSLALDASGYPVVSYQDFNRDLRILHCNDANCSGGDESITSHDSATDAEFMSLALDASGFPVVSYFDDSPDDLKVLHCNDDNCNDDNCSGGDESITSPDTADFVGQFTSLALDASGNPGVGYLYEAGGDLKVLHCNDDDCSGADGARALPLPISPVTSVSLLPWP